MLVAARSPIASAHLTPKTLAEVSFPRLFTTSSLPRNQELVGVVNEQLPDISPGLFGGPHSPVVAFGAGMSRCLFHGVAQAHESL
jgi:hypothetical protein